MTDRFQSSTNGAGNTGRLHNETRTKTTSFNSLTRNGGSEYIYQGIPLCCPNLTLGPFVLIPVEQSMPLGESSTHHGHQSYRKEINIYPQKRQLSTCLRMTILKHDWAFDVSNTLELSQCCVFPSRKCKGSQATKHDNNTEIFCSGVYSLCQTIWTTDVHRGTPPVSLALCSTSPFF